MIKEAENKGNSIIIILMHGHKFRTAVFLFDIFDILGIAPPQQALMYLIVI